MKHITAEISINLSGVSATEGRNVIVATTRTHQDFQMKNDCFSSFFYVTRCCFFVSLRLHQCLLTIVDGFDSSIEKVNSNDSIMKKESSIIKHYI